MPNIMVSLRLLEDSKGTQRSMEVSKLQKVTKYQGKQGKEDCEIDMLDTYHIHITYEQDTSYCTVFIPLITYEQIILYYIKEILYYIQGKSYSVINLN